MEDKNFNNTGATPDKKKKEIFLIVILVIAIALVVSSYIRDRKPKELSDEAKQDIINAMLKRHENSPKLTEEEKIDIINSMRENRGDNTASVEDSQKILEAMRKNR